MSKTRISPILALTIIRQILRGEGEYAAIAERGDQLDAIGEMVDDALSQVPISTLQVEVLRQVDTARLSCLEALVLAAKKQGMTPARVSGEFGDTPVSSMQETIVAVFSAAEPEITFGSDDGTIHSKSWVKLNTQSGDFFQGWGSDGWYLVEHLLHLDPAAQG